jgi:thiol-disulfide isomerase/thioredoxin
MNNNIIISFIIFIIILWLFRKQIKQLFKFFINKKTKIKSYSNTKSDSSSKTMSKTMSNSEYGSSYKYDYTNNYESSTPTYVSSPQLENENVYKKKPDYVKTYMNKSIVPIENYKNIQPIIVTLCYANWCGHCPAVKKWFLDLVDKSPLPNMEFVAIEEKELPKELSSKIQGFPTILISKNNSNMQYEGDRSASALIEYLKNL